MTLIDYLASHVLAFVLLAGLLGLIIGSFLNVVIHRLPRMMERDWRIQAREILEPDTEHTAESTYNLVLPHSHCPHCEVEIKAWQNVPVVSYVFLRGRCAECKSRISPRYPLVELLTAALSMVVAWQLGFGWAAGGLLLLTWGLIALSLIDADTQLLPDVIVLPLLWLGLIVNSFDVYTDLNTALWGAVFGYLSLWSVYWLFKLVTGKEGMGYGDFKLLAVIGAWGGWQVLPLTILLSSLVGAILGIIILKSRGDSNATPLPFGPYLAIAGWIALIWGEQITGSYLRFAGL
ncbi:prepilin peptidase [Pseudomonas saliphila]|uniref:prepilin peptidase n=1 Tax=Pseudomonas saliphila TaxID=2586906 RepID=UPI001238F863|nr:A24 family peptidase [Pseudomonas saliphila]